MRKTYRQPLRWFWRRCALGSFLFIAIPFSRIVAQQTTLDSLKRVVLLTKDSLERCRNYYYVGHYEASKHPDIGAQYADSALTFARSLQNPEWINRAYRLKGLAAYKKGDLTRATEWHGTALELALKNNDLEQECQAYADLAAVCVAAGEMGQALAHYHTFKAKAGNNPPEGLKKVAVTVQVGLGIVLKSQNKLAEAAEETKEGLELCKRFGYTDRIWDFYDNLGNIYGRMGDYPSKLTYHRKSLAFVRADDPSISVAHNNLANAFLVLNMLDSAAWYYQLAAQNPNTRWKSLIHSYNGLSQVYFEKGQYAQALAWAEKSVPLAEKAGNALTIVATKTRLGKSLLGLKRYPEAISLFREILTLMDANKDFAFVEERTKAKQYLAQAIALQQGAPQIAELIDAFSRGRDSIHNFVVTQSVEALRIQYETRQKEDSLRILQMQHQIQSAKAVRYRISFFGGLLLALALLVLLFYIIRQRRLEREILLRQNEQLRIENQALFELKQQLEHAPPRSLHDFANVSVVLNGNDKQAFRLGDILYIQAQGNGVQVVTPEDRHWRWQTLRNLEAALPGPPFLKVHRSYLINGIHIREYRANRIVLTNGDIIPVGVTQAPQVMAFLRDWLPELA